ncbi:hypothetical protein OROGR_016755 [Orobanche gracilis]
MEFETQPSTASIPCPYVTATTTEFYYSATVSPRRNPSNLVPSNVDHHPASILDDFEFESSKKFSGHLHFNSSDDYCEGAQEGHNSTYPEPFPSMAFADELFLNGLVMPLKLPPRLQHDSKSAASSPKAASKFPFPFRSSWNDDFDPFAAALQKVREEEKRGRNSRRSRSYSPFRAVARCSSDCTYYVSGDFSEENSPTEPASSQVIGPRFSGPLLDFKGSAYARFVRDQTGSGGRPRSKSPRRLLLLGERVRPLRSDQDGLDKKGRQEKQCAGKMYGNGEESKLQKLKGFLLKYALLLGRGSKQAKKRSERKEPDKYYSRLGYKSKADGRINGKT